jgi:hypothetical protein
MLRHKAGDEVINFALPACDRHGDIVGEWKAKCQEESAAGDLATGHSSLPLDGRKNAHALTLGRQPPASSLTLSSKEAARPTDHHAKIVTN